MGFSEEDITYLNTKFGELNSMLENSNRRIQELTLECTELRRELSESRSECRSLRRQLDEQKDAAVAVKNEFDDRLDATDVAHDNLEQYGRRQSIPIQNVQMIEGEKDNPSLLLASINKSLEPLEIQLANEDIVRLHRSSKPKASDDGGMVSQCIVKLVRWNIRRKFHGLNKTAREKRASCRVYHDLTKRRLSLLNRSRDKLKAANKSSENCFVYCDVNSNLKFRSDGKVIDFNTDAEFDAIVRNQ